MNYSFLDEEAQQELSKAEVRIDDGVYYITSDKEGYAVIERTGKVFLFLEKNLEMLKKAISDIPVVEDELSRDLIFVSVGKAMVRFLERSKIKKIAELN